LANSVDSKKVKEVGKTIQAQWMPPNDCLMMDIVITAAEG
jgi:hypothetical protein